MRETGAGFPDISLLEPVADALALSVTELLRGERMEAPQQETEETLRDAARTFGTKFKSTVRRLRWLLIALAVVAALLLIAVLCLWALGYFQPWHYSEEISASEALDICPFALITMEEFEIAQMVLQDEALTSHLPDIYDENHTYSPEDIFEADSSILSRYEGILQIDSAPVRITSISVSYSCIYIDYRAGDRRCILSVLPFHDRIEKTCAQYDYSRDLFDEALYCITNRDNRSFFAMARVSKLSLMLSK